MSFEEIWDNEVKQLAVNCVTDNRMVNLMMTPEENLTDDDKKYLESIKGKYKDPYGMFYISEMIWKVEHGLADGRECQARLFASQIYSGLSDSLLQNVFKGDETDEEWILRAKLKKGLGKLLGYTDVEENSKEKVLKNK